jgi:hypothetical protein
MATSTVGAGLGRGGETKSGSFAVHVDANNQQLMPIYLSWQNLLYNVEVEVPADQPLPPGTIVKEGALVDEQRKYVCCGAKTKTLKATKTILNNVTGYTEPGKLLAIMGSRYVLLVFN